AHEGIGQVDTEDGRRHVDAVREKQTTRGAHGQDQPRHVAEVPRHEATVPQGFPVGFATDRPARRGRAPPPRPPSARLRAAAPLPPARDRDRVVAITSLPERRSSALRRRAGMAKLSPMRTPSSRRRAAPAAVATLTSALALTLTGCGGSSSGPHTM